MKILKIFAVGYIIFNFSVLVAKAQENGTVSYIDDTEVILPLFCREVQVDNISDNCVEAHFRVHFEDGVPIWRILFLKGTVISKEGVTFEITAYSKFWNYPVQEAHYNLKGNDGSHYVGSLTYENGIFSFSKAICPGN
jgi:hypothetical protein